MSPRHRMLGLGGRKLVPVSVRAFSYSACVFSGGRLGGVALLSGGGGPRVDLRFGSPLMTL